MDDNNSKKQLNFIEKLFNSPTFKKVKNKNSMNETRNNLIKALNEEIEILKENNEDESTISKYKETVSKIENDPYFIIDQKEIDAMLSHKKISNKSKTKSPIQLGGLDNLTLRMGPTEKLKITKVTSIASPTIDEYELILSANKNDPNMYKLEREITKNNTVIRYTNFIYGKIDFNKLDPKQYMANSFTDNSEEIHDCENYRAALCDLLSKDKLEKLLLENNGNFGTLTKNKHNGYVQSDLPNSPILDKYLKSKNHTTLLSRGNYSKIFAYEIGTIDILNENNETINSLEQYIITRDKNNQIKSDLVYAHIDFKLLSQPNETPNNYTNVVQTQLFSENNIAEKYLGSVSEKALYVTKDFKLKDLIAPNKFQNLNFNTIDIP